MGVQTSLLYDVCVVELIKSRTIQSLQAFLKADEPDTYLCLGHFDIMKTMRTCNVSFPLEKIQTHIQNICATDSSINTPSENCRYPLYMLKQLTSSDDRIRNELDQFWTMDCNFCCVIRFHCDRCNSVNTFQTTQQFSDILLMRSRTLPTSSKPSLGKHPISRLSVNREINAYTLYQEEIPGFKRKVRSKQNTAQTQDYQKTLCTAGAVVFYDSLELGDVVGIVKSNSLSTAMDILQHLYSCEVVSNAYTYCGVDCKLLQVKGMLSLNPERKVPLSAQSLTCTTRFCVKLAQKADLILKTLLPFTSQIAFVTGTADIIVEWPPCTEEEFLSRISELIHCNSLYEAFTDIITRIGIPYTTPWTSREKEPDKTPFLKLLGNAKDLAWLSCDQLKRWRYPIRRLVGTLQSMYESSVLDALARLLIPGVDAFLARMHYIQENNQWDSVFEQDVTDFLDRWATLANDISHLESQIVQHPDLTPARYYIPAMVLQFERTLLEECVYIIEKLDEQAGLENSPRAFNPILLPTSEDSVYTLCPLDPEFDVEYSDASPLCIFLPIHRIYQPWELAIMLCHEIQHYSGDALRNRELRLKCIANSASAFLVSLLRQYLLKPGSYQPNHLNEEQTFQDEIAVLITQQLESLQTPPYLKYIQKILPRIMFDIVKNNESQEELQNILCMDKTTAEKMDNIYWMCHLNTMEAGVVLHNYFEKHARYLCGLYKECYADIVTILTLQCSFQDYFRCIFGREQEKYPSLPADHADKEMMERHTDRLAMVILTVGANKRGQHPDEYVNTPWAKVAWEKVDCWQSNRKMKRQKSYRWKRYYLEDEVSSFTLTADEALQLENYLTHCAEQLKSYIFKEQKRVNLLRSHLEYVSKDHFNWNNMRDYLYKSEHQHRSKNT